MGATVAEVVAGAGRFGPLARAFAGAEPAAIEKAKQAIAEALTPHEGSDGVRCRAPAGSGDALLRLG